MIRRRALPLLLLALPGCTLIDQRTFNPEAGMRPTRPAPPAQPAAAAVVPEIGPPPLLLVRLPLSDAGRADVAKGVASARARKPDVVFDVVEVTSGAGATVGADAAELARLIAAQGVPAARIHLAARPVPNAPREVRVYVH